MTTPRATGAGGCQALKSENPTIRRLRLTMYARRFFVWSDMALLPSAVVGIPEGHSSCSVPMPRGKVPAVNPLILQQPEKPTSPAISEVGKIFPARVGSLYRADGRLAPAARLSPRFF